MFENNLLTRFVSCSVRSCVIRPSPKLASSRLRQRLGGGNIANLTTEALLPSVRFVFESLWLFLFTYHMYLKYHAFYLHMSKQDSYYQGVGTTFSP